MKLQRDHYSIQEVAKILDSSEDDIFHLIQALSLQPSVYFDHIKCKVATSAMDLDSPANAVKYHSGLVRPMIFEEYCISTLNPGRSHEWKCDLEGQCVVYPHVADHDANGDEIRRFLYPVLPTIITAKDLLISREGLQRFEARMNKIAAPSVKDDTPYEQPRLTMNFPLLERYTFDELATRWRISTDLIASYAKTGQLEQAFRVMDGENHIAWIDKRLDHLSTGPVFGPFILEEEVERWERLYFQPDLNTPGGQPTPETAKKIAENGEQAAPIKEDIQVTETVVRMLAAVAIDCYGYDPESKRSTVVADIQAACGKAGVSVSDNTIRRHLKTGASMMNSRK